MVTYIFIQVSLSVSDICLECLMTTQGDTQLTVPLQAEPRGGGRLVVM